MLKHADASINFFFEYAAFLNEDDTCAAIAISLYILNTKGHFTKVYSI